MTIEELYTLLLTAPVYQRGALVHVQLPAAIDRVEVHHAAKLCRDVREHSGGAFEFLITAGDVSLELAARTADPNAIVSALLEARRSRPSVQDQVAELQKRFILIERSEATS